MVFSFVSGAGGFVQGMDKGDELKLLRIRTRKSEIVIVPGRSVCSIFCLPFAWFFCVYERQGGNHLFYAIILILVISRYQILISGYS